jgi:hypothetical protein
MNKYKLIPWAILIGLAILLFFENKDFFSEKNALVFDFGFNENNTTKELPNYIWFLGTLCVGFLIAYFFTLVEKFKSRRIIKAMKAELDAQAKKINQFESQAYSQRGYSRDEVMDAEPVDVNDNPALKKP